MNELTEATLTGVRLKKENRELTFNFKAPIIRRLIHLDFVISYRKRWNKNKFRKKK